MCLHVIAAGFPWVGVNVAPAVPWCPNAGLCGLRSRLRGSCQIGFLTCRISRSTVGRVDRSPSLLALRAVSSNHPIIRLVRQYPGVCPCSGEQVGCMHVDKRRAGDHTAPATRRPFSKTYSRCIGGVLTVASDRRARSVQSSG